MLPIHEKLSKLDLTNTQIDFEATNYILLQCGIKIVFILK